MPTETTHLSTDVLQKLLGNELDPNESQQAEQHLIHCEGCRAELKQLAGDQHWWEDVSDLLPDDEFDAPTGRCENTVIDPNRDIQQQPLPAEIRHVLAWLEPTDDPMMLGRLGGYEICGVIGSGGMGVVLKGFDRSLNRFVAIKTLAPHLASSGAARQRFAREAQAAAAVVHPNVIAIHSVSDDGDLPWLVMPYIRGTTVQRRLDEHGAFSVAETLRVGLQMARGLAAAHDQGLVHRDIKPANILLDGTTERVLLTDFGLARAADDASLTHSGVIAGTPHYMSPEQSRGNAIDHRSDLFSLGSVMYSMCTGVPPFRAETNWGVLRKVTDNEPLEPSYFSGDVPVWLENLIAKLHRKNPDERFVSAVEAANLLEDCLAHAQQPKRHPVPDSLQTQSRPSASGRIRRAAAVLIGLGVLAAATILWMPPLRDQPTSMPPSKPLEPDSGAAAEADLLEWPQADGTELKQLQLDIQRLEERSQTFLPKTPASP